MIVNMRVTLSLSLKRGQYVLFTSANSTGRPDDRAVLSPTGVFGMLHGHTVECSSSFSLLLAMAF